jgi:hypothetical protein
MPLTFGRIREIVAPYAGRSGLCADDKQVAIFARSVMQYLLFSGSEAAIRKVCIQAVKGCLTLPPEIEIPLKVRVDRAVGTVWNKWMTYHSQGEGWENCPPCGNSLQEEGETPLQYPLPVGGSQVGVLAKCDEDQESSVIIQGTDPTGREIYTTHRGEKICGEKLTLKKNQVKYGQVKFGHVTSVLKERTNGYVLLYAVNPAHNTQQFLADYSPAEERPSYQRFRLTTPGCADRIVSLSMLVRVRLKDNYHDNELTIFDNELALMLGAQRIQAETNDNTEVSNYKRQAVEDILEKEGSYKAKKGDPVEVFFPLSGGSIFNII